MINIWIKLIIKTLKRRIRKHKVPKFKWIYYLCLRTTNKRKEKLVQMINLLTLRLMRILVISQKWRINRKLVHKKKDKYNRLLNEAKNSWKINKAKSIRKLRKVIQNNKTKIKGSKNKCRKLLKPVFNNNNNNRDKRIWVSNLKTIKKGLNLLIRKAKSKIKISNKGLFLVFK